MSKLEKLIHEKKQLEEKIKREQAKTRAVKRKVETQEKILIGSALIKALHQNQNQYKVVVNTGEKWEWIDIMDVVKATLSEKDHSRLIEIYKILDK